MARPRKTRAQYLIEYWKVVEDIRDGVPYRKIAKNRAVGLSTVQRVSRKLHLKIY